eukprot:SAG11_NODE_2902_length_2849_cov_1.654909_4_plen_47_part_00
MLEGGSVRVVMDSVFGLEAAAEAHARMQSSGHVGKIALRIRDDGSG